MIHPSAIVDPGARLHESVEVGPWTLIGPDVEIGAGTVIESHVVIKGPTRIGARNHIYQFTFWITLTEHQPDGARSVFVINRADRKFGPDATTLTDGK